MAEFDVMGFYEENAVLIFVLYALIIGYFVGKNGNRIRERIRFFGHDIDRALCRLFDWFESQAVHKKPNKKYEVWSFIHFYFVVWLLITPIFGLEYNLIVWLLISILAFAVGLIFLFYQLQFTKDVFGTEIIKEETKGELK